MGCNCKRINNFKELESEISKNKRVIRVSMWLKIKIFGKYLLFTFINTINFGYNLFHYDNLKEWTGI